MSWAWAGTIINAIATDATRMRIFKILPISSRLKRTELALTRQDTIKFCQTALHIWFGAYTIDVALTGGGGCRNAAGRSLMAQSVTWCGATKCPIALAGRK